MRNNSFNTLEIIIWDVQHGNAILIKTPNKKIIFKILVLEIIQKI